MVFLAFSLIFPFLNNQTGLMFGFQLNWSVRFDFKNYDSNNLLLRICYKNITDTVFLE